MNKQLWSEKIIWLTGASSGIGAALVHALQSECAHLFISARNEQALAQLAAGYRNVTALPLDVTSAADMQQASAIIEQRFGRLDVLLANAGTCEYVDVKNFNADLFQRVFSTNFFGLVNSVQAALPLLRQSPAATIAGVSSSVTALAMPRAEAYGASKAAATHFLQSLAADLAPEGIQVSIVSPGFVQTPLTDLNDFPMPAMISAEQAAHCIVRGLKKGKTDIHFPRRFTLLLRFIGLLPDAIRYRITKNMVRHDLPESSRP